MATGTDVQHRGVSWKSLAGYAAMIAGTIGGYQLLVRVFGRGIQAPTPAAGQTLFGSLTTSADGDMLLHVLLALVVVILVARGVGSLFRYLHQPPVVGEILAGILLGPSLLGRVAPGVAHFLLPTTVAPYLNVLSQVGVILYMFLVGVELDPGLLRKRGHATVAISHASIIAPLLLGSTFALVLYPRLSTADVPFYCFALFIGVSMSVTAFPVLARILTDRRIHTSRMGVLALTCAAVDDVTAWCLLAFVVSVVQARMSGALLTAGLAVGFIAFMALAVRPAMVRLTRWYGKRGQLTQGVMAIVFVALLLCSLLTDVIGIHAVFGAFALGAVIPHDSGLARELTNRLEDLVVVLLLPAFFAFTGMRTEIGLVSGTQAWLLCGAIILIASAGKFGGSFIASRLAGLGWRDASALGVLMNTRGLMELIVLNIGLELHVLSPALFAMLVLMAVTTTFMTTPILHLLTRNKPADEVPAGAPPARPRPASKGGVLAPISNPAAVPSIVSMAVALTKEGEPPPRILALVRRPAGGVRSGLREMEQREPPHAPVLLQAMEQARTLGAHIVPQAMWSDEPAHDLLQMAQSPDVRWLVLGFHRPVFGQDVLGGTVRVMLEHATSLELNVAVVIHGHERSIDKVVVVTGQSADGRAALELASRVARSRKCPLHAVLVPGAGEEPEPELQAALKEAANTTGKWLHTDVLVKRTTEQLLGQTQASLVVMGSDLADSLGLPMDPRAEDTRCIVLVRGGAVESALASPSAPANWGQATFPRQSGCQGAGAAEPSPPAWYRPCP